MVDYIASHGDRLEKLMQLVESYKTDRATAIAERDETQATLERVQLELKNTKADLASTKVKAELAHETMATDHAAAVATSTEKHADEVRQLREENESMAEAAATDARKAEAKHKEQLLILHNSASEMKMQLSQREATAAVTKRECAGLREEIIQLRAQLAQHVVNLTDYQRRAQKTVAKTEDLRAACAAKDEAIADADDKLKLRAKELAQARTSLDIATCETQQLKDQFSTEAAVTAEKLKARDELLQASTEKVEAELAAVKKQVADVTADRDGIAERLQQSEMWLDRASSERTRLLETIDKLDLAQSNGTTHGQQQHQYVPPLQQGVSFSKMSAPDTTAPATNSNFDGVRTLIKTTADDDVPQPFQLWDLPAGYGHSNAAPVQTRSGDAHAATDHGHDYSEVLEHDTSLASDSSAISSCNVSFDQYLTNELDANLSNMSNGGYQAAPQPTESVHVHIPCETDSQGLDARVPVPLAREPLPRQATASRRPPSSAHAPKAPRPPSHMPPSPKPPRASKIAASPALDRKSRKAAIAAYLASRNK